MAYSYSSQPAYKPPTNPGQAVQSNLVKALSATATPPQPSDMSQGVEQASATNPTNTVYTPYQQAAPTAAVDPTTHQPAAPAPAAGGGGGGGQSPGFDFSGDPILARIRALNAQNIAQAEASALAQRKRAEIGYGYDPALKYEDPSTQAAAQQNPFSVLSQLLFNHTQRAGALDENLNKSNLFYSGERAKQVGLEGRQSTLDQTNQQGQFQNTMNSIAQAVMQARQQAQQSETQGESDAYGRAIQEALAYGGYGGSGGGSGGGGTQTGGFEQPFTPAGSTNDQAAQAAQQYAAAHPGYSPHMVMQEGTVTYQNGKPGYMVKYNTPQGTSTEWTPL